MNTTAAPTTETTHDLASRIPDLRHVPLARLARDRSDTPVKHADNQPADAPAVAFNSSI